MNLLRKKYIYSFFLLSFAIGSFATGIKHPVATNLIKFTENRSQWGKNILFRAQLDGGQLFLERNCFTYNFYDVETLRKNHVRKGNSKPERTNDQIRSHAFRLTFLNALLDVQATAKNQSPDYCNFYLGKDKNKWVSHANNYKEVNYKNLYSGIDLQVLGMENSLKYNFLVAPNASPNDIRLYYEGLESITLLRGALRMKTSVNELMEEKPFAYQFVNGEKVEVPCNFVLEGSTVRFNFPKGYDKSKELVIDPVLVFACSSGSLADNFGMTATYDGIGNLYAGGTAFDAGYPVTLGAYDPTYNGIVQFGRTDVVITKYDSSGTFLQYSTYIGGASSTEVVSSLVVNAQDELFLFGATGSNDFPVTPGAYDTSFSGGAYLMFGSNGTEYSNGTDLYVAKFNATGTALLACSYMGGSQNEGANSSGTLVFNYGDYYRGEIQVDNLGNCYVASCTFSSDFPVTPGCLQSSAGGGMDGVLFKMDPNLTSLTWSTYLGGAADDGCYALVVDNTYNVYTTGGTSSTNFPTSAGCMSPTYGGGITDGYVTKVSSNGSSMISSTYIGTNQYDQNFLIQLDNTNNVYVVGQSLGMIPISAGVYSNPNSKQYILKMDSNMSTIIFSTVFGNGNGQVNISPAAFLVDICGNIYVCGWGGNILLGTPTAGMPITPGAYQPGTDGFNFYLLVLTPNATSLMYGTYFGGSQSQEHVDGGTSRFDKKGIVYQAVCAGCGGHDDFPVTPGAWPNTGADVNHNTQNNNCNMGVFKFDFQATGVDADAVISPNDTICMGDSVHFNNSSLHAFNYSWDFGDGSPTDTSTSPVHQYPAAGTYNVTLIAYDSSGCVFSDTSSLVVVVAPNPVVQLSADTVVCQQPNFTLDAGVTGLSYLWSTGDVTQTTMANAPGNYWIQVSNGHCFASDSMNIQQLTVNPSLGNDTSMCAGQTMTLNAFLSGATYLWSTGAITPSITVSTAGQYWVKVTLGPCFDTDTINVNYIPYPAISLPSSSVICDGDSVILDPGGSAGAYLWSTTDTSQTITVSNSGVYTVTASNAQCTTTTSTTVTEIIFPLLIADTTLCAGQTITLNAFYPGASYLWSTGATISAITVGIPGPYWVNQTFSGCSQSDTATVTYISYPVVNLPPNITICPGDTAFLDAGSPATGYLWSTGDTSQVFGATASGTFIVTVSNQQCQTTDTSNVLQIYLAPLEADTTLCAGQLVSFDVFVPGATYNWSTGATTPSITVAAAGQYWVVTTLGACHKEDTVNVNYIQYPVVNLPSAIELCPNDSVILDAGNTAATYLWSSGDTTQTYTVTSGGTYVITASNQQCAVTDTSTVTAIPPVGWNSTEVLCDVEKYTLNTGIQANSYLWSTGETTPTIDIIEPGQYWVIANTNNCIVSDTLNIEGGIGTGVLWFPNSFTPNSNGLNDKFAPKGGDITYMHLMIFDRWGEMIFETENMAEGWDGFYKGKLAQQDVYVWKVKYKTLCSQGQEHSKIGHVTLVR